VVGCSQAGKTFAINKWLARAVVDAQCLHAQQVAEQQDLDYFGGLQDEYKNR
jgi:hypothetical protein